MKVVERTETGLLFEVDASLYGEDVLFKCLYWYTGAYDVVINRTSDGSAFRVSLARKENAGDSAPAEDLESRLRRDLVDFKTRDIVAKETRVIRELLIAKAFASFDDLDSTPPGSVSDPVGFDPSSYGKDSD